MTFPPKSKPWSQRPNDHGGGEQTAQWMDWATTAINQLIGQGQAPPLAGLQSLAPNVVDPTGPQITSAGSRMSSITTALTFNAPAPGTSVQFFWDGTNSSVAFQVYRDDGTLSPPSIAGSGLLVTGLVNATKYFFYPYYDEALQLVKFATVPGVAVGSPPFAFLAQNLLALQQTILRGRIPTAILLITTGITTGVGTGSGGSGGGGGGGGGGGRQFL